MEWRLAGLLVSVLLQLAWWRCLLGDGGALFLIHIIWLVSIWLSQQEVSPSKISVDLRWRECWGRVKYIL